MIIAAEEETILQDKTRLMAASNPPRLAGAAHFWADDLTGLRLASPLGLTDVLERS